MSYYFLVIYFVVLRGAEGQQRVRGCLALKQSASLFISLVTTLRVCETIHQLHTFLFNCLKPQNIIMNN